MVQWGERPAFAEHGPAATRPIALHRLYICHAYTVATAGSHANCCVMGSIDGLDSSTHLAASSIAIQDTSRL